MQVRNYLIHICICFCCVCRLPIPHNGFHNGGPAAEGRWPTVVEAAEGRLHYGGWGGGKHSKHICKYVSNMCELAYLANFLEIPLRISWSYSFSEIWSSVQAIGALGAWGTDPGLGRDGEAEM